MRLRWGGYLLAVLLALGHLDASAGITIGAGSSIDLGSARLGMNCGDLMVEGTLRAGTDIVQQVGDLTIAPGGTVEGQSALIIVNHTWDNSGTFMAGTSEVRLLSGCSTPASGRRVLGSSTFFDLSMVGSDATWLFEAGATQIVLGELDLDGPKTIRSTVGGSEAFLDLQGTQTTAGILDVDDVHAVGQTISLPEGSVVGGNAAGWAVLSSVPVLRSFGLVCLVLVLGFVAVLRTRTRLVQLGGKSS